MTTQMVDWDLAVTTAGALAKGGPRVTATEAGDVVADLRRLADLAEGHVRDYTGLRTPDGAPPVRVVDRRDWVSANVDGLRTVIGPLVERLSDKRGGQPEPTGLVGVLNDGIGTAARAFGAKASGVQAGTIFAYLSTKVLGQYEVFSGAPGELLLVAPNIVEVERKLDADPTDFRLWVCLHEVTHRAQFTAVPWLRQHFLDEVNAFVDATDLDGGALAERLRRAVDAVSDAIRNPDSRASVIDLIQTPGQKAVVDRITALMTLVEGHAEFVMDGVGPTVVPSVERIRAKFNARRVARNPVEKVLRRLLGVEVKMRQYAEGRTFVAAVVDRVGMTGFNQIWTSKETLPRPGEIADPDAWVARVHQGTPEPEES